VQLVVFERPNCRHRFRGPVKIRNLAICQGFDEGSS